jgi:3-hydroxyacyl-CoA dehydrogenase
MRADVMEAQERREYGNLDKPNRSGPALIRRVAVLGAGNMGSRIAAHLANAGVPVVLLDIVPELMSGSAQQDRSRVARGALEALKNAKPSAFFDARSARLITVGNFEDDLELLRDCDWIIEVVAENLEIKRKLLAKIAPYRGSSAIITTNTSGLPISQIAEGMDQGFRRRWFGTHFFNPPRYMRLLEIIPAAETDMAVVETVRLFGETRLGKTVVFARDTPNFIANRIGTFAMMNAIRVMQAMDLSIEQVDVLTGSVLGWPKTGTFRLGDMVGIDVLASVAKNFFERVKDERSDLTLPDFLNQMLQRRWLGDKSKQGFYKKEKGPDGAEVRFGLDWKTLEYRPSERARFPVLEMAKSSESLAERIRMVLAGDPRKDQAAAFYWQVLPDLWNYAAYRVGEIAGDIVSIDRAMRTGFNWEMGPFELWDAAGVIGTTQKMSEAGTQLAPAVVQLLKNGNKSWYRDAPSIPSGRSFFDVATGEYQPVELSEGVLSASSRKQSHGLVKKNAGASLIDLGDGVASIEFHTKMNAIGTDIVSLVTQTLRPDSEAVARFDAFVIANEGEHFSAGANLMQLLLGIQEQEWDEIDLAIRLFQKMTQTIKFCPRPVVIAPFNLCLGGGAEVALHGAARQAHAELYMGLVETGVGLIPAGGGCKEMLLRALDAAAAVQDGGRKDSVELIDSLRRHFETIAMAKTSTSAAEAREMGYLGSADGISMNRDRLLNDAKTRALEMTKAGYAPPLPRTDIPAPGENILASLKMGVRLMREGEYISDHDVKIANWLAYVLCGGKITPGTPVTEQYLLDLERQAFLSLCGEKKTAERIAYTLKNGKPLRN